MVAEERGEHGEFPGAALLVPDVAFFKRAAGAVGRGGPYLRRPEEEQARVVPERAAGGVRLPPGDVRRDGPRERRGPRRRRRSGRGRRSRRRRRRRVVLRGGEHEEALPQARGADAAAGLERVPLAPHAHLISSHLPRQQRRAVHGRVHGDVEEEGETRRLLNSSGRRARSRTRTCPALPFPFSSLLSVRVCLNLGGFL